MDHESVLADLLHRFTEPLREMGAHHDETYVDFRPLIQLLEYPTEMAVVGSGRGDDRYSPLHRASRASLCSQEPLPTELSSTRLGLKSGITSRRIASASTRLRRFTASRRRGVHPSGACREDTWARILLTRG